MNITKAFLWAGLLFAVPLNTVAGAGPEILALQLDCRDLDLCADFYERALDFVRVTESEPVWRNGSTRIVLRRADEKPPSDPTARIYLNLSVGDLERMSRRVLAAGGRVVSERLDSAVGPYLEIEDPSGNLTHIIDHPWDDLPGDASPVVFNIGLSVLDIASTEAFLTGLGFTVSTRDYLPKTLVFHPAGMSYLVIHLTARRAAHPDEAVGRLLVASPKASGAKDLRGPSGILFRLEPPS